jgi:hypothetical protein
MMFVSDLLWFQIWREVNARIHQLTLEHSLITNSEKLQETIYAHMKPLQNHSSDKKIFPIIHLFPLFMSSCPRVCVFHVVKTESAALFWAHQLNETNRQNASFDAINLIASALPLHFASLPHFAHLAPTWITLVATLGLMMDSPPWWTQDLEWASLSFWPANFYQWTN